jgi:hypothetical protein
MDLGSCCAPANWCGQTERQLSTRPRRRWTAAVGQEEPFQRYFTPRENLIPRNASAIAVAPRNREDLRIFADTAGADRAAFRRMSQITEQRSQRFCRHGGRPALRCGLAVIHSHAVARETDVRKHYGEGLPGSRLSETSRTMRSELRSKATLARQPCWLRDNKTTDHLPSSAKSSGLGR